MADTPSSPPNPSQPALPATPASRGRLTSRNIPSLAAAVALALVLVIYMFSFITRYQEPVVVTTFERASAENVFADPGWHFKWPWPIQRTYRYDARLRSLDLLIFETQTQEQKLITVAVSVVWKINDPLVFFRRQVTEREAEKRLRDIVNSRALEVVGRYPLTQLVNVNPQEMKIATVEGEIRERVNAVLGGAGDPSRSQGMQIAAVQIKRLSLPERTTEAVFNRMKEERRKLASTYRSRGEATANEIRSKAEQQANEILAYADRLAAAIRSEGYTQAAKQYRVFDQDRQFASFLSALQLYRQTLKNRTVFVLDSSSFLGAFEPLVRALNGQYSITGGDGLLVSPTTQPVGTASDGTATGDGPATQPAVADVPFPVDISMLESSR